MEAFRYHVFVCDQRKPEDVPSCSGRGSAGELPDELSAAIRGFQESRVILTAIELDIFTAVGQEATAREVSAKIHSDPRATEMLMNALVALGLLAKREGVFHNTPLSARYFVAGSADDARTATLHLVHLWRTWSTLSECVRAGTSVYQEEENASRRRERTAAFIAAMHRNARERAPLVIGTLGTENLHRMLDVGGGSGAYSIAFARAVENLQVDLLDLPSVIPIAQGHIDQAGLSGRIKTRPGDLRTDSLGKGYDLVLVSAICHMLSPAENRDLMKRCSAALSPKGRVVIQDFILDPDRTSPKWAALFALNMLVGTEAGNTYTEQEYAAWLSEAGFQDIRRVRLPGPSNLMVGRRA